MTRAPRLGWVALAAALAGCSETHEDAVPEASEAAVPEAVSWHFVDVAPEAGLTVVTHGGRPGKDHLLDSAGTGAAWLDYDRDGWLDAFVVNCWKLEGSEVVERGPNALYHNRGDGTFEEVTAQAGVGGNGDWGSGVCVADYDADGWPDILVTHFGPTILYRNRGDGTFENVAAEAGIECPGWNTGAALFDADGDGDLDLYVAGYIDCTMEEVLAAERSLSWKGVEQVAFGPFGLNGARDHFFLSDGRGKFTEATEEAGLIDHTLGFGFAVRSMDYDGDGDQDLYVANDSDANYLYRNGGDGVFREVGLWSGAALDANGAAQAGMGVAVGDLGGDGDIDIFVTNFSEDFSTLYECSDRGFYRDVSAARGVGMATRRSLSWGTAFLDLDCDGDLDLVLANGHIYPQVDAHPEVGQTYAQLNILFENTGKARFKNVTGEAGPGFQQVYSSRGLAAGDYDNDGDLDLLITHLDRPPSLLRNDSRRGNWLAVACEVPPGEGTAIGSVVTLEVGERTMSRDLASGDSYMSVHTPRLHFGLGEAARVDRVVVRFPGGTVVTREDVEANQLLTITPGS